MSAPRPDGDPTAERRLIAGSIGPERRPYRHDPDEPRWFEPLHVRAPGRARDALAALVAAGADILVAPTWQTHRRALLPVGETRRAPAWTAAAVRIAREAIDRGLELRETAALEAATAAERAGSAPPGPAGVRHPVLVAGVLPSLEAATESDVGRLLPRDAAGERDHRAAAGLLADGGADLLLVEGGASVAGARIAVEAAVATGLPAWVTAPVTGGAVPTLPGGASLETWAETMSHAGATALLLAPAASAAIPAAIERVLVAGVRPSATGVLATLPARPGAAEGPDAEAAAHRWVEAGAWHLGIADGATAERIAVLRSVLDAVDGVRLAARAAAREDWAAAVRDAARRAPGGRAAWVGPREPIDPPLPAGFHWTIVAVPAAATLPEGAWRLVICPVADLAPDRLTAWLEPGGVLLAASGDPGAFAAAGLRILDASLAGGRLLARRDP